MYYLKLINNGTVIEFHNNWLGEETVVVKGKIISKKSSIFGTSHYFAVRENGEEVNYILTTRMSMETGGVAIDLSRNGHVVERNVSVGYAWGKKPKEDQRKKLALQKLNEYDLEAALEDLRALLNDNPEDPELYFHMACAHSVMENTSAGYSCLQKAVEFGLGDTEAILTHDMLAYLRMQPAFQSFLESGFTMFDLGERHEPGTI